MEHVFWIGLLAGLATLLGGTFSFRMPLCRRALGLFLAIAAGIMLFVVAFDLLPYAVRQSWPLTVRGLLIGVILLALGDLAMSFGGTFSSSPLLQAGILIACGIAFHDLPEGVAIGAGYSVASDLGANLVLAIGLHNLPEGMAVAVPLLAAGVKKSKILWVLFLISFCTPIGAIFGFFLAESLFNMQGLLCAVASGAMLYVALIELLPQAWKKEPFSAIIGLVIGPLFMLLVAFLERGF